MPLITTNISYEYEEGGAAEALTYQKQVEDLDIYGALWYVYKLMELMGYDVKQIQLITNQDKIYKTDI